MNTKTLTYLLEHPEHITTAQTSQLRSVIDQFPYFQSAYALYLKGLKNQESFSYNKALKRVAAATADRSVLFDFITSALFNQNDISEQIKSQEQRLRGMTIQDIHDVSEQLKTEELAKADQILDPALFVAKENSEMTAITPEETLKIGSPLTFDARETHSFSEWLRFASFKPIDRSKQQANDQQASTKKVLPAVGATPSALSRKQKRQIIDSFIETNPKINVSPSVTTPKKNIAKERLIPSDALMTETLARVYIEQKNFKKAKQAFRILSLKYPEKSGFFADQIRAIEQLEEN
ncbi:MAG: hypothetical protein ABNH00_02050 [Dokdonia sp.]|nr:hypothetical protein [Cytophagaceae bacterium]